MQETFRYSLKRLNGSAKTWTKLEILNREDKGVNIINHEMSFRGTKKWA